MEFEKVLRDKDMLDSFEVYWGNPAVYHSFVKPSSGWNVDTIRGEKTAKPVTAIVDSSMEEKNTKNSYLFNNNLNNQISAFDLITMYKIPKEEDLKLYDIVIYEVDGILVIHRIVGIEEISKEEILHIAKLASLKIKEEEIEEYRKNLADILNFAKTIDSVNTEGLEETNGATANINVLREDEIKDFEDKESLMQNAPEQENNMFKIPKVLN